MDYLYISSNDRIRQTETSSNFTVHLNHPIENKHSISLSHFSVLNTMYNVTSLNNRISVHYSGNDYHAMITEGAYNISTLTSALKTALDNNGSTVTYTVTYDSTTFKLTISGDSAFSLLFGSESNQINQLLGFPAEDTSSSTSHVGSYAVDLHSPILFIRINQLGTQYNASNRNDRMTFVVPVQVNSGDAIIYNEKISFDQKRDLHGRALSELHIQIVDKNNKVIDLHGAEVTMIFTLN